ncbi:hypothetical protein ABFS83_11G015700 [Erythranthe nasuta]
MAVAITQLHGGFKPLPRPPKVDRQSFTHLDFQKMLDFPLEHSFNLTYIHKSFSTPCLSHPSKLDENTKDSTIEIIVGKTAPRVHTLVVEVAVAMAYGFSPEPASNGLSGAYFLHAENGDTIAVAKPVDEEAGMKNSIRVGETGLRESAAYLLDHDGFSGVPPTALVKFSHVEFDLTRSKLDRPPPYKIASLQRFVDHDSDAGDLGPSSFSVTSVHHIGILDVRLMNLDRHAGNILVRQGGNDKAELVPIDHGFCLPESLDDPYFEWLHWPQASVPFSEGEVDYISTLDMYKDAELLRNELPSIRESSIRVLMLCTVFLKEATAYGMCLSDIGEMMTREFRGGEENWSSLEKLCLIAMGVNDDNAPHATKCISFQDLDDEEWESFLEIFEKLLPKAFEKRKSVGLSEFGN